MAFTADHAMQLLDFSKKLDIGLLDGVVDCFYNGAGEDVGSIWEWVRACDKRLTLRRVELKHGAGVGHAKWGPCGRGRAQEWGSYLFTCYGHCLTVVVCCLLLLFNKCKAENYTMQLWDH